MPDEPKPRLHPRWSKDDEHRLRTMIDEGHKVPAIAVALGRSKSAIMGRKTKLGLSLRPDRS